MYVIWAGVEKIWRRTENFAILDSSHDGLDRLLLPVLRRRRRAAPASTAKWCGGRGRVRVRERLIGFDPGGVSQWLCNSAARSRRGWWKLHDGADSCYDEINLNCGCLSDRCRTMSSCCVDAPAGAGRRMRRRHGRRGRLPGHGQAPYRRGRAVGAARRAAAFAASVNRPGRADRPRAQGWLDGLSPRRTAPSRRSTIPVYDLSVLILIGRSSSTAGRRPRRGQGPSCACRRSRWAGGLPKSGTVARRRFGNLWRGDAVLPRFRGARRLHACDREGLERGERLHDYTRDRLGLFAGRPGARFYRRALATEAVRGAARARRSRSQSRGFQGADRPNKRSLKGRRGETETAVAPTADVGRRFPPPDLFRHEVAEAMNRVPRSSCGPCGLLLIAIPMDFAESRFGPAP